MFEGAHSQIDDQQKRLEALDTKPGDNKVVFGSKDYADTYLQKVDDFQNFVRSADVPDELKKQQFEDVAKFLRGVDAGTSAFIEQLTLALTIKLSDFKGEVETLDQELDKRHEVKSGDTVSKIVESKLGIEWKDDPARFFAGVKFLQDKRQDPGCVLTIQDGKVKWEAGPRDPNSLEVGEYFVTEGLEGVKTGAPTDVDWYLGFSSSAPYERAIRQELSKRVRREDEYAGDEAITSGAGVHGATDALQAMVEEGGPVVEDRDDVMAADDAQTQAVLTEADGTIVSLGASADLMSAGDIDTIPGDPAAIDGLQSQLSRFAVMRDFSSIWQGNVDAAQAMAVTLPEEARDRVNDRLAQISHILSEMLKEAQKSSPDKAAVQEWVDSLGSISDEVDQMVLLENVLESVSPQVEEAWGCVDAAARLLQGEEVSETLYSGLSVSQLCLSAQDHYGEAYRALLEHLAANQDVLSPSSIEEVLLEMDALKQEILGVEELRNVPKFQEAFADYPDYFSLDPESMAIVRNEAFQALPKTEQEAILKSLKENYGISGMDEILELNAEFCPAHQAEFHEGRRLFGQGEMTKAKPHLLAYVRAVEGGSFESYEAGNLEIAKNHLVMIGQFEIAQMKGYLQKMQESLQLYMGGTLHEKRRLELTPLEALPMLQTMDDVLDVCEAALVSGAVLTVEEARARIVASGKGTTDHYLRGDSLQAFQRDRRFVDQIEGGVFDVFTLFERLNSAEGAEAEREAVLELARYYREHGLPQVASLLFDQYFAEEYQTLQKENPTLGREYFEQEFERDPKLREDLDKKFEKQLEGIIEDQLDMFRDGYEEENGVSISKKEARQLLSEKITSEEKIQMKDQIKDQMVTDRWQAALKIGMINKREATGVKDIFTEEYNQMMEFDRSWYEFWRMTDSQFDSLMENLWVEIVSLLLSFGTASRVSTTVMRRAVTRQLTKKIGKEVAEEMVEKALREGGEEAVKTLGRQMLGRGAMMGAGATAFAGENTAFVMASGGLNGMRSGDFSQFTSVEGFAKAWGHSALTLLGLKFVGSAYGGTVGRLGTSPASMAGRSAVGQLGIRGGHMLGMNTAQVMALTGLGAGEMYLHGELTQGAVAESILQNTLITVAFTAAHAPQGRFQGRPVRGIEGQSPAEIARRLVSEASVRLEGTREGIREGMPKAQETVAHGPEEMRVPRVAERAEVAREEGVISLAERAEYTRLLKPFKSGKFGAKIPVDSFAADVLNRALEPGDVLVGEHSASATMQIRLDSRMDSGEWRGTDLSSDKSVVVHVESGSSIRLIYENQGSTYLHAIRPVGSSRALETLRSLAGIEMEVLGKAPKVLKHLEPPGDFEPGAEFARIRAMPRTPEGKDFDVELLTARQEAMRSFRERSHEQQLELGKIPDRIREYVRQNPDATLDEVVGHALGNAQERLRFSRDQRIEVMERIVQYMNRREAVQRSAREYKGREKELLALIFGKKVEELPGDVRMEVHDASLFFDIADPRTYELISGIEGAARDTGGLAFAHSEIAELRGAVTVGNNVGRSGWNYESIVRHEVRHAENKLLFPPTETGRSQQPIHRVKDEIIAYMRDGSSKEYIVETLTKKDGLYDYFKDYRNPHIQRMSELVFSSPDGLKKGSTEYAEFIAIKDAIAELDAQREAHVSQVRDSVEIAFQVGPSNLDLLAVTPYKQWRRLKVEEIQAAADARVRSLPRVESLSFRRAMMEAFKEMSEPIVSVWEQSWSAFRSGSKSVGEFLSGTKEALAKLKPELETWKALLPRIPDFEVREAVREQYDALVVKARGMKESMQVARLERAVVELEGVDLSSFKTPEALEQFTGRLTQLKGRLQVEDRFKDAVVNEHRRSLITRLDRKSMDIV